MERIEANKLFFKKQTGGKKIRLGICCMNKKVIYSIEIII
jgi:hypothetical protein